MHRNMDRHVSLRLHFNIPFDLFSVLRSPFFCYELSRSQ